ncbi:flagellar filament capping protein FliD [Vogesella indigofera]|uniref:Flagellar hook-associated protein 2 n=1 Tax=Vogesella indigofera TaxID=45465 RepID=A0ABT5I774_VOGIN|nr:flagellar filament capping protein FliD [Vogesella indigofera]MDC7691973.1 flagellar filament capping protein FliD [Vogesella indigofera]
MAITTSGSNFDVQGLVSQLMSLEQAPLTSSKKRVSSYNEQLSSLGKLKSELSSFQSAMRSLISGSALSVNKADSSDSNALKGVADSSAAPGSYTVNVTKLAAAQTIALGGGNITSASAKLGNSAGTLTFTIGGTEKAAIDISADASLDSIRAAINAKGYDVTASVVNSGTDGYKLVLSAKNAGSDGEFTISAAAGAPPDDSLEFLSYGMSGVDDTGKLSTPPSNAELTINGVAVTASSNKLTEALTGIELNLYKTGTTVLTVARDNDAVIKNVQAFVDGYNKIKSQVDSMYKQASTGGAVTDASGKAIGTATRLDGSVRMMMQTLSSELGTGVSGVSLDSGFGYLSQVGISIQKDGSLKLDAEAFKKALDKDAGAVQNLFSNSSNTGFADRLNAKVNQMLSPDGMLQVRSDNLNQQIRYEQQKQDQVQTRLDQMQKRLLLQFSKLDSSMAAMNNQSSYLAAMLR